MTEGIFAAPNGYFALESFFAIIILLFFLRKRHNLFAEKRQKDAFVKIAVSLLGALFCSFLVALPSAFDVKCHLISNTGVLNGLSVLQVFFLIPIGFLAFEFLHLAFFHRISKVERFVACAGSALYWIAFILGVLFASDFIEFYRTLNLFAFLAFVILPLFFAGSDCLLRYLEGGYGFEHNFSLYTGVLCGSFILLSLSFDVVIPYAFEGSLKGNLLWNDSLLWFFIFLMCFALLLVVKESRKWQTKMHFMLSSSISDGVLIYTKKGKIVFSNAAASELLQIEKKRLRGAFIQKISSVSEELFFKEYAKISLKFQIGQKTVTYSSMVFKDMGLLNKRNFILVISKDKNAPQDALLHSQFFLQEQIRQNAILQKVEEEVHRQEWLLRTFMDYLPMQISVKNAVGVYILQNRQDEEAHGKLLGINEMNVPEAESRAFKGECSAFDKIEYADGKKKLVKRALNIVYLPVDDGSGRYMVLKMCRDITESVNLNLERRNLLEHAKRNERLQDMSSFMGMIAHEFNNILGAQLGFLELAKASVSDVKVLEYLKQVENSGNREKELISKMLESVRENLANNDKEEEFSLAGLILNTLAPLNIPKNVVVENVLVERDIKMYGDSDSLRSILSNIFDNAVYAMRRTGGCLYVNALKISLKNEIIEGFCKVPLGNYVCITVSDTGEGIPSTILQKLFSPFFTTKEPGEGLGLGLYTALKLARAHKGEISVQTKIGKGTIFKVYWPLAMAAKE